MLEAFLAAGFCVPAGGSVPRGYSGQPLRALFTAWTIREMVTIAPDVMPLGQEDASAFPRSMYTRVMTLFTATVPLPSQSPTHVAQPHPHLHTPACRVHFEPQKLQGALVLQDNLPQAGGPRKAMQMPTRQR